MKKLQAFLRLGKPVLYNTNTNAGGMDYTWPNYS